MKTRVLLVLLAVLGFTVCGSSSASENTATRMDDFKKACEKEEERLVAEKLEALQDIRRRYLEALKSLADRKQAAGELEPVLIVRKETERFEQNPVVEPEHLSESVPELRTLQETYLRLQARTAVDYWEGALRLVGKSDTWLDRLQRELTREGDLESALGVKQERRRVAERREVVEAELKAARDLSDSLEKEEEPETSVVDKPKILTPEMIDKPNLSEEKYTIKRRYQEFYRFLTLDKWDKAIEYVNPQDVERKGTDALKLQLRFISGLTKLAGSMDVKTKPGKATLQDDSHAVLVPRHRIQNDWRDGRPVRWVKIDGKWYVDVD